MKILFCSPYRVVGGISRWTNYIMEYYNTTSSSDIKLDLYYGEDNLSSHTHTGDSLFMRIFRGVKEYYPMCKGVNRYLKNGYDAIHLCSSASISLVKDWLILQIAHRYNAKFIIHFHFGRIPNLYKKKNWEYRFLRKVIKSSDKCIVIDRQSYNTLVADGFKNIEFLPNPLTPEINKIIEKYPHVNRENNKIVFAGHVIETKGVFELVEACKNIPNIKLVFVGFVTDSMKDALLNKVGNDSGEWLQFLGEQNYEATIKQMLSASVFVLPSYTEGFPNVILESMACACPIVATNVGAIPEMLDVNGENKYGICINPKNVQQLKKSLEEMLSDRNFAIQCGKNAQKRVNELYSLPLIWKRLKFIWQSTI